MFGTGNSLLCIMQALVDRPDEVRRIVNFKRLQLTDYKIDIPRIAKKKVLAAALEESGEANFCSACCMRLISAIE